MRAIGILYRGRARISEEDGVIESALVLIPLLVLFLISLQLIVAVSFRNIDKALVQAETSQKAINPSLIDGGEIVILHTMNSVNDIRLIVTHRGRRLPQFLSDLSHFSSPLQRSTFLTGVAVMEEPR